VARGAERGNFSRAVSFHLSWGSVAKQKRSGLPSGAAPVRFRAAAGSLLNHVSPVQWAFPLNHQILNKYFTSHEHEQVLQYGKKLTASKAATTWYDYIHLLLFIRIVKHKVLATVLH
jgi:hypothetical protein